jgi:transposase
VFYLGVDVSKGTLSVNLRDTSKGTPLWTNKNISNTERGFAQIADTAINKIVAKGYERPFTVFIGMESTGVYGERLAHYFYGKREEGFVVYVLNPMAVRAFAKSTMTKNKNDSVDAQVIASYMSVAVPQGIVSSWVAPSAEEIRLTELSKRREELVGIRAEEKQRLEKHRQKAQPDDEVVGSVEGLIRHLSDEIERIEKKISDHVGKHPKLKSNIELMRSIPGIGEVASVIIQSETGGLDKFASAKQLTSYVGLSPQEHTSGTSVHKKSHIGKRGNPRVRRVMFMCAMVASRRNPVIKTFYERLLARGKGKKVAIAACMRKLLHILWGVVKNGKEFDPEYAK